MPSEEEEGRGEGKTSIGHYSFATVNAESEFSDLQDIQDIFHFFFAAASTTHCHCPAKMKAVFAAAILFVVAAAAVAVPYTDCGLVRDPKTKKGLRRVAARAKCLWFLSAFLSHFLVDASLSFVFTRSAGNTLKIGSLESASWPPKKGVSFALKTTGDLAKEITAGEFKIQTVRGCLVPFFGFLLHQQLLRLLVLSCFRV